MIKATKQEENMEKKKETIIKSIKHMERVNQVNKAGGIYGACKPIIGKTNTPPQAGACKLTMPSLSRRKRR